MTNKHSLDAKQIKNKHIYNITEDKHIKAHKSTLISNLFLPAESTKTMYVHSDTTKNMYIYTGW